MRPLLALPLPLIDFLSTLGSLMFGTIGGVNDRATNHDLIALIVAAVLVIGGGAGALVS